MGIGPTLSAWKAEVLPLNHTCNSNYKYDYIIEVKKFNNFLNFIANLSLFII